MKNLNIFRKQIDKIDRSIVILLTERMKVVKKIGLLKKENNLPVIDKFRWKEVIKSKKGFLKKILLIIHQEALKIEKNV